MIKENDLTKGNITKSLVNLAVPVFTGCLVQQLYILADSYVLGRFINTQALTAVNCTSWIYWLLVSIFSGFTQGYSILISQKYGAKDFDAMRKTIAMSYIQSFIITIIVTVFALSENYNILLLLKTPMNVIEMSHKYLLILSSGLFVTMLYNLWSSVLRAIGDTKTIFIALIVSSIVNIILDIIFVVYLKEGVKGAAVATLIAQVSSCIICLIPNLKIKTIVLRKDDWKFDSKVFLQLFRISFPMAFQNIVISLGGLIMQRIINSYGFIFTSAISLTSKVSTLIQQAGVAFSVALGTFVGQNAGAENGKRIRTGIRKCLKINIIIAVVSSIVFSIFGKQVLSVFLSMDNADAIENIEIISIAYKYLLIQCAFMIVVYILYTYRAALLGTGDTFFPMISGIVELLIRIISAIILPWFFFKEGIFFADGFAWLGAGSLLIISYYRKIKKIPFMNN